MDALDKLFGSPYRAKILRLFLLNPEIVFDFKLASQRTAVRPTALRKELALLRAAGFIRPKVAVVLLSVPARRSKKHPVPAKEIKKRINGWQLNHLFPFSSQLRALLNTQLIYKREQLLKRFSRCGKIKFLAISGVFLQDPDSRADLVIVGDKLKRGPIEKAIRALEAELGRELNYATFETSDFTYRLNSSDRFVRDVLDYPHERVINKIAL